jgi:hypothetical protein
MKAPKKIKKVKKAPKKAMPPKPMQKVGKPM